MKLEIKDGRENLWQWDTGRTATVDIECDIVHFSNLNFGNALAVQVRNNEVQIPNQLLKTGADIYAWAFVEDADGAYTKEEQVLKVNKRAKPDDYVYTETEVLTIKTVVKNALAEAKESGEFDGEKGEKGDTGKKGADGKTPKKGVDYFTESEKQEIVIDVINALPEWQGGSY